MAHFTFEGGGNSARAKELTARIDPPLYWPRSGMFLWLTASVWPHLPNRRRVPEGLHSERQPPADFEPAVAARQLSSAWALQRAALFLPKAVGRQCARPQLPFRAWLVQVPFAVKQRTHLSCFTFVLEQAIKRRVCVHWRVVKEWCQASSSAIYLLIVIFTPQTFSILTRARKLPARINPPGHHLRLSA